MPNQPTDTPTTNPNPSDSPAPKWDKVEQERLTRRAALRKMGYTSSIALFSMFAVDDLARMAIKQLEQHKETREIAETVAKEFKNAGIAIASPNSSDNACSNSPSTVNCEACNSQHYNNCLGKKSAAVCYNQEVACETHCNDSTGDSATLAKCWGSLG